MRKSYILLCFGSLLSLTVVPQNMAQTPGTIITYAGDGASGYSGDGGRATSAELFTPYGVALDKSGNVYIADANNACIRKVTASTGTIATVAGTCTVNGFSGDGGPAISARMSSPASVAVDGSGNLYIADTANRRIRKVNVATGIITTVAGSGTGGYSGDGGPATSATMGAPYSVAADSAGNIFIPDSANNVIRKVAASTGVITTVAGKVTPGYTGDGKLATGAELAFPQSVAVDKSGSLYFLDQNNAVVRKVGGSTGIISTVAGNNTWGFSGDGGPATHAQINDAESIGVDSIGNVYIADTGNQRIRKVTVATGIITTIAGNGNQGFSGDATPATMAELNTPFGIAIDPSGNVYIADVENNRVREVFAGGLAASTTSVTLPAFPPLVGKAVDLKAKISGPLNSPKPTGRVTFHDGTILLGSASLNSTGTATFSIGTLSAGTHAISATYSGDAHFNPSISASSSLYVASTAAARPTFSPAAGTYASRLQVALRDNTPSVSIFYTTNGSTPSATNGTQYIGAITVNATETIQALAVGPQYAASPVATATYVIHLPYEAPLPRGKWAWEGGSGTVADASTPCGHGAASRGIPGVYGSLGVSAAANVPGSRYEAMQWTDKTNHFWLFGGSGFDSLAHCAMLNDLWRFDPASRQWTWMSGSSSPSSFETGVYGTLGRFAPGNVPGSRNEGVTWTDKSGHLWLFGGAGYDSAGNYGILADLWEFDPASRQWAWMGGSKTVNQDSVYGKLRVTAAANTPGSRWGAAGWTDSSGNFWLFGGIRSNNTTQDGFLNDLWAFNPATGKWTWMGGSNVANQNGVYGTRGKADARNIPGGRGGHVIWTDSHGHVWLFGGEGETGSSGATGFLNDLWAFNPATLQWTWLTGSNAVGTYLSQSYGDPGVYGTLGTPAPGNTPGSRTQAMAWTDAAGHLWLFGGEGFDVTATYGFLCDLWEFVPSTGLWAWMGGSTKPQAGVYGQLRVPATANMPGSRSLANNWTDNAGHLWLFGGEGYASNGGQGLVNDLWEYTLP